MDKCNHTWVIFQTRSYNQVMLLVIFFTICSVLQVHCDLSMQENNGQALKVLSSLEIPFLEIILFHFSSQQLVISSNKEDYFSLYKETSLSPSPPLYISRQQQQQLVKQPTTPTSFFLTQEKQLLTPIAGLQQQVAILL